MRIRFALILASIVSLAVASATFADHHKGREAKGKGYEKSMDKGDKTAREAGSRGAEERDAAGARAKGTRGRGEAGVDRADKGRGAEMRTRRDERKAIMEEAKSSAEPGTPRKGKKPWYRFWESDEQAAPESAPKPE
jgi:hypothetical protein